MLGTPLQPDDTWSKCLECAAAWTLCLWLHGLPRSTVDMINCCQHRCSVHVSSCLTVSTWNVRRPCWIMLVHWVVPVRCVVQASWTDTNTLFIGNFFSMAVIIDRSLFRFTCAYVFPLPVAIDQHAQNAAGWLAVNLTDGTQKPWHKQRDRADVDRAGCAMLFFELHDCRS